MPLTFIDEIEQAVSLCAIVYRFGQAITWITWKSSSPHTRAKDANVLLLYLFRKHIKIVKGQSPFCFATPRDIHSWASKEVQKGSITIVQKAKETTTQVKPTCTFSPKKQSQSYSLNVTNPLSQRTKVVQKAKETTTTRTTKTTKETQEIR